MQTSRVISHHLEVCRSELEELAQLGDSLIDVLPAPTPDAIQLARDVVTKEHFPRPHTPRPSLVRYKEALTAFSPATAERRKLLAANPDMGAYVCEQLTTIAGIDSSPASYQVEHARTDVGSCSAAEGYFVSTLRQIFKRRLSSPQRITVFHDPNGLPLMLQKSYEAPSALTLQAMQIGRLTIPAGVIAGVDGAPHTTTPTGRTEKRGTFYRTFQVSEATGVDPMRASAWAFSDELDRSLFAVMNPHSDQGNQLEYDPKRGKLIEGCTIDDFREAAARVMKICGVTV